jgi:hypothetical protein
MLTYTNCTGVEEKASKRGKRRGRGKGEGKEKEWEPAFCFSIFLSPKLTGPKPQ